MIAIQIDFLTGRYHATPWGAHVNEGRIEWPPSPYRFLRALAATWLRKHYDSISDETMSRVVEWLAGSEVTYHVPHYTEAHTRHYMVDDYRPHKKDGKQNTSRILDAFVLVDSPLWIRFEDIDANEELIDVLTTLVDTVPYLGRAEAWTSMRLVTNAKAVPAANVSIEQKQESARDQDEAVELFAPLNPTSFQAQRKRSRQALEDHLLAEARFKNVQKGKDPDAAKLNKKKQQELADSFPHTMLGALMVETDDIRSRGWSVPPGMQSLVWQLPRELKSTARSADERTSSRTDPQLIRLGLSSQVLPSIMEFVPFAEKMRSALIKLSDGHIVFAGKDRDGTPLKEHEHTFIIPSSLDQQGRVHEVLLVAEMGYDQRALAVLARGFTVYPWRRTYGQRKDEARPRGYDVEAVPLELIRRITDIDALSASDSPVGTSRVWQSVTPFVPTRHPHSKDSSILDENGAAVSVGSPLHDLYRLLELNGFPAPERVERIHEGSLIGGRHHSWLKFNTQRGRGGGSRANSQGHGYRLIFEEPVQGPIVVGFGAHFGLGLFRPAVE